ncbi:hypothetical protein JYJ95_25740 [Corallococcus exiguus]|uniref:hypothetical protein n=1 Tax=Corallococcus exiguus TaxID=83462 RepID=UPI001A906CAD|nr:hypothetical protein [Corallococcus exiguus]MBN8469926.1 hypothetical protein [Corallococcus exiguus]
MRSRVLFPLCLTGLLLACASGARSTSSEAASSDSEPVQPCAVNPTSPQADVLVTITASPEGKVHFSSTTLKVLPGQTVGFVSQVQQDRCIRVQESSFLEHGSKKNPLLLHACTSATWTLKSGDEPGAKTSLWSCPTSDCSTCTQSQGIRETINGTLEVTGRGED